MKGDEEQRLKFQKMTTRPVEALVRSLFVPTVITMLITSLYNIVDTFFVARLGTSATGAVGAIFAVMAVIQAVGFGFGHGAGNYVSRKLGERHIKDASIMATVGFVSSFLTGMLILACGLTWLHPLTDLVGVTPTIHPYAADYLRFILLGAPFFASSLTINNMLRLQGNASFAMVGVTIGAVLNACMDPFFIFTLDMGISGAGLSTFISQVVSFMVLLVGNERSDAVKLRPSYFRPSRSLYVAIFQGGCPSLGRQGMRCVANVLLNHAMKLFGDEVYAAITIVTRLANLIFAIAIGIGQGFQPVCGFNYGARLYRRVLRAFHYTQRIALIVLVVMCGLIFVFAEQVTGWFTADPAVRRLAVIALRLQCITIPFMGYANIASMLFQNINKYKQAFITAIGRDGLFFIPAVILLPRLLGLTGIMLVQPVADMLTFLIAVPLLVCVIREIRALDRTQGADRDEPLR